MLSEELLLGWWDRALGGGGSLEVVMRRFLLVVVVAVVAAGCVNDRTTGGDPPATTAESTSTSVASSAPPQTIAVAPEDPATSFSWGTDVEAWVTTDEVAALFEELSVEYLGTSLDGEVALSRDDEGTGDVSGPLLSWSVRAPDGTDSGWSLFVHDGEHVRSDLAEGLEPSPLLPDGVTFVTGGWGIYTFEGPASEGLICIAVGAPEEVMGTPPDEAIQRMVVFEAASTILQELGWADSTGAPDVPFVHPGTDALTDAQIEMLDVLEGYLAAWKARDGDLAATYMTEDAVFEYHEQGDAYSVADGSLQARISNGPYNTMRFFEPRLVYGNRITLTGTVDAVGVEWLSVIRFVSDDGTVLIDKETVFFGP